MQLHAPIATSKPPCCMRALLRLPCSCWRTWLDILALMQHSPVSAQRHSHTFKVRQLAFPALAAARTACRSSCWPMPRVACAAAVDAGRCVTLLLVLLTRGALSSCCWPLVGGRAGCSTAWAAALRRQGSWLLSPLSVRPDRAQRIAVRAMVAISRLAAGSNDTLALTGTCHTARSPASSALALSSNTSSGRLSRLRAAQQQQARATWRRRRRQRPARGSSSSSSRSAPPATAPA